MCCKNIRIFNSKELICNGNSDSVKCRDEITGQKARVSVQLILTQLTITADVSEEFLVFAFGPE